MHQLEKRVSALEAKDTRPHRWVWRNTGETTAEAIARAGFAPDDNVIVFGWRDDHASH